MERAAVFFQSLEVTLRVVGLTVFPTGVDDALPFEGQAADGAPVAFLSGTQS